MSLYDACYDFFSAQDWNTIIQFNDGFSTIEIDLIDIVTCIVGVVLLICMFKLFGIALKKVFR